MTLIYLIPIIPLWIAATVILGHPNAEVRGDDVALGALAAFCWPGTILILFIYYAATVTKFFLELKGSE